MAQRGCTAKLLIASVALALALLLLVGGSFLAVRRGVWAPPPTHFSLGPYEINTGIVPHADCIMYMSCAPLPPGAPPGDTFVVSLITHEDAWTTSGRNVLTLPVAP